MKRTFCALRFTEDENLEGRIYWYEADFSVKEGDTVLAPVGSHDGLQRAEIVRVLLAEEGEEPYDPLLIKRVAARLGERVLEADGVRCLELGGVKYDRKRYTAFGRVLICDRAPEKTEELVSYGVRRILAANENVFAELIAGGGCALVCGENARSVGETLLRAARGEDTGLLPPFPEALARILR